MTERSYNRALAEAERVAAKNLVDQEARIKALTVGEPMEVRPFAAALAKAEADAATRLTDQERGLRFRRPCQQRLQAPRGWRGRLDRLLLWLKVRR